jgi:hypothetical protein
MAEVVVADVGAAVADVGAADSRAEVDAVDTLVVEVGSAAHPASAARRHVHPLAFPVRRAERVPQRFSRDRRRAVGGPAHCPAALS